MEEQITIVYTSDVHGQAMPIHYGTNEEADHGLAKYATALKTLRKSEKNLLVIDNGDLIQGTPFMTNYMKVLSDMENPMIGVFNQLKIDAGILGNHEFNYGAEKIAKAVEQANYPILSANILNKTTSEPQYGPPYMIKELASGVKVCIIGVTTHFIPKWEAPEHIKELEFADAFKTLKKWVRHVKEYERPDVIIASYHGGFEADIETGEPIAPQTDENQGYRMCKEIDGIDVLLTGHQHRKLTGYINDVLVIQPGSNGAHFGKIDLALSKTDEGQWKIVNKEAGLHSLENIPADQSIISYLEPYEKSAQKWLDQHIGMVEGDMTVTDPFLLRMKKHPFIQFIHNVQMDASGADISVTSLLNNESKGFQKIVTVRDLVSNFMYPNTLVVLELSGADIKEALEQTAAYFILDDNKEIAVNPAYIEPKLQHYNYDMWEGIEYALNIAKPIGERVEYITYHNKPVDPENTYHVVLSNYRAAGGGNYHMFPGKRIVKTIDRDTVELIQAYFKKHPIVKAETIDNFKIIY